MPTTAEFLQKVSRALGRESVPTSVPVPPVIDEPIVRLVHSEFGLPELFVKSACEMKMLAELVGVDELAPQLIAYLRQRNVKSVATAVSPLLEKAGVYAAVDSAGLVHHRWDRTTMDALYDVDAGITDVYAAVAETGSLVVRASASNGRSLSLVPPLHIAIVEPKNLLPDLVDLFAKLAADGKASAVSLITGPSKTSDIEMNLVVGVHGPVEVKIFVLH